MSRAFRLVETPAEPQPKEYSQLVDRLSVSMGKLARQREDVLELTAAVMWAQQDGFHGTCAGLNYEEAEMLRRDLRGSNNPSLGMFLLRLIERPTLMRGALDVMARLAKCHIVVDETPALAIHEAKADLQLAHASLQALIDRSYADGHLDDKERADIRAKLIEVSDRVARVNRAI